MNLATLCRDGDQEDAALGRRDFVRIVGSSAAATVACGMLSQQLPAEESTRTASETLVKKL